MQYFIRSIIQRFDSVALGYVCNAKLLQFCLTLCDPADCGLLGPSAHGILQARILEQLAMHARPRGSSLE